MSWLDDLLGPVVALFNGSATRFRPTWDFRGAVEVTDDGTLEAMRITVLGDASRGAGMAGVLYVSKLGNDATAVRGSLTLPYLTVQAALDDARNGDSIVVGAGTFADGELVFPDVEALTMRGCGDTTIIDGTNDESEPAITIGGTTVSRIEISDLQIVSDTSASTIVDCVGNDSAELLRLRNVRITSGLSTAIGARLFYDIDIDGCQFEGCAISQFDRVFVHNCIVNEPMSFEIDIGETLPADAANVSVNITDVNAPAIAVTATGPMKLNFYGGTVTGDVTCTFTTQTVGGSQVVGAMYSECVHADVWIRAEDSGDEFGTAYPGVIRGQIESLTATKTIGTGTDVHIDARGSVITGAVDAKDLTEIDVRGATHGTLLASGTGAINRSHESGSATLINGVQETEIDPPYIDATYIVLLENAPVGVTVESKAVDGFGLGHTASSSVNYVLFQP
jgi:hypothetical protein